MSFNQLVDMAEDRADAVARAIKPHIVSVARFFLISTFIEDGFRMILQFAEQRYYLDKALMGGSLGLAVPFIFANIFLQFGGSALVMANHKMQYGVGALLGVVFLQVIGYTTLHSMSFFLRSLSLCGSLILMLAEAHDQEGKTVAFGGLTDERENRTKTYMQLAGRCLIVLMQLSLMHSGMSALRILSTLVEGFLIVLVAVGYKTKLSALVLVVILQVTNFFVNAFWMESNHYLADVARYDFFQTLAICGGLLYIVHLGGGDISIDKTKKDY